MSILASPEYVSAGSRITWTGQFSGGVPWSPGDVISGITSHLSNKYQLAVEKSDNNISWVGVGGGSITLWLRTDSDRGDGEADDGLTDILNNVSDEFKAYNAPLTNASINNYTPADSSGRGTINTGTQLKTTTQQNADKPNQPSAPSWWDQFIGKIEAGSVGFVIGGVAVVAIIIVVVVKSEV